MRTQPGGDGRRALLPCLLTLEDHRQLQMLGVDEVAMGQ